MNKEGEIKRGGLTRVGSIKKDRDRSMSESSTKSIDSWMKRTREEEREDSEREEEVFRSSKKTRRSPGREERMMEKIKEMTKEMHEMKEKLVSFEEELNKIVKDKERKENGWRRENEKLRQEVEMLRSNLMKVEEQRKEETGLKADRDTRKEEERTEKKEIRELRRDVEKWREEGEREKRKINIIIKGVEPGDKEVKKVVEELWKVMGVKARAAEVKEIGRRSGRERRMVWVRMEDREGKIEVMKKKIALRGRTEKIEDDWTLKERAIQWRLEKIAWEERRKGRRAWVRYGKIWMEDKWWWWNEESEKLTDGEGREREEKTEKRGVNDKGKPEKEEERMEITEN